MPSFNEDQILDELENIETTGDARLGKNKNGVSQTLYRVIRRMNGITPVDQPVLFLNPALQSKGWTGSEWVSALLGSGVKVTGRAIDVLTGDEFDEEHVTDGCKYDTVFIHGDEFSDDKRTTKNIRRVFIDEPRLGEPPAEVAPLLVEDFLAVCLTSIQMEYDINYLVILHTPIENSDGDPHLLRVNHSGINVRLDARRIDTVDCWDSQVGFVFLSRKPSLLQTLIH